MVVNDNASLLVKCDVLESIASRLAPTRSIEYPVLRLVSFFMGNNYKNHIFAICIY